MIGIDPLVGCRPDVAATPVNVTGTVPSQKVKAWREGLAAVGGALNNRCFKVCCLWDFFGGIFGPE